MARLALFLYLLSLTLTLSRARDITNSQSQSEPEPQTHHPEPKTQHDTVSFTIHTIDPVPLTLLRFRPINRHFHPARPSPLQLPLSLRTGHRRCRHDHRREIPYGNDAIVLADADATRIHPRWVRVHSAAATWFPATVERFDSDREHRHGGDNHHHATTIARKIRKFMNLF